MKIKYKEYKISEICELKYGKALKSSDRLVGEIPVYGSNGIIGFHNKGLIEHETLIIGRKGSIGEIHYSSQPSWPIDTTYYLEYDSKIIYIRWFKILLEKLNLKNLNRSASIPGLNRNDVYKIKVRIPPIEEQILIVNGIMRIEALITKRKESIILIDELVKSTFLKMFGDPNFNVNGWERVKISDVCNEIIDCVNKTAPQVKEVTPFKMVRTSNIKNGTINLNEVKYVDKKTYQLWTRRSIPQRGDILLTREAPIGEVGIVDFDDFIFLGQRILQYRINEEIISPLYILSFMQNTFFQDQIKRLGKGSTVKHIAIADCYTFTILLPPLSLQSKYAQFVKKIDTLKNKYKVSLIEFENLYNSFIQCAFQGEIDLSKLNFEKRVIESLEFKQNESTQIVNVEKQYVEKDLVKILKKKTGTFFNFSDFFKELGDIYLDKLPQYDEMKKYFFDMMEGENPILFQFFDKENKEIVLGVNHET